MRYAKMLLTVAVLSMGMVALGCQNTGKSDNAESGSCMKNRLSHSSIRDRVLNGRLEKTKGSGVNAIRLTHNTFYRRGFGVSVAGSVHQVVRFHPAFDDARAPSSLPHGIDL